MAERDEQELRRRAEDGLAALVELLGGDLTIPRLQNAPAGLIATLENYVAEQDTDPAALGRLLQRALAYGLPEDRSPHLIAWPFEALCDAHLLPWSGTVAVVYDPGQESGTPIRSEALSWIAQLHATGLTNPGRISMRIAHFCFSRLAGGVAVRVLVTDQCKGLHVEPQATLVKGDIHPQALQALDEVQPGADIL